MVSSITRTQGEIKGLSVTADSCDKNRADSLAFSLISLPTTPLFGTDGIRGKVGEILNAPLALEIGFWAGVVLQNHTANVGPVILGQDSRNSSDMLAMALSAGLTAAGVEVWYLGLCPTPCVAYLTSVSDAIGGVMISASHNPPEDNGIKVFGANGAKLPQALQAEIEAGLRGKLANVGSVSNHGRHYARPQLVGDYSLALQQPLQNGGSLQGMKIVLDLAWGAAVGLAPQVFMEMGAEVVCLHNAADGDRINVECGSTHLDILQAAVKEHHADMGFAFDGDADRVLAVDNTGRQVNGDYILYLWGRHLQQQQQLPDNLIVSTVMANLGFERAWQQQGGKLIRTAVGDQYVQAEMLRTGGMLGGEQSGHILCKHYGITGDGLLTALHIASLVKQAGVTLGELVDQSFQTYPQLLKNVRVVDRDRRLGWKDCLPVQQAISLAEAAMGDAGRILVRASGTEPVIRVMVEAADAELTQHWTNELVTKVQQHLA
ncbi:phosphoglucosamine mutase [Nostoc sp. FACHB-152]|uniref:phosphoglucosamine mutase n=1 Tax=unclassified Nostoc TaxID=2593658 RepID=UPI0016877A47|nr:MULTISPECIES: phosphoglucosamine mutase [unclassified Nostoc]MBD2448758.1 phosphoglucosamine mutase [Nostoc sp. FACHB-152]MBD2467537.1 phosphoglucosamine mutase [Nostoc sp. FACHB-145]